MLFGVGNLKWTGRTSKKLTNRNLPTFFIDVLKPVCKFARVSQQFDIFLRHEQFFFKYFANSFQLQFTLVYQPVGCLIL